MSVFGPPPGSADPAGPRRPPSYLPPEVRQRAPRLDHRYALPTSHRPGIIPLRPLGLGDILDGAVKHVRRNPRTVLALSAVTTACAILPAVLLVSGSALGVWLQTLRATDVLDVGSLTALLLAGGVGFAVLALSGLLAPSVAEAALGHRPDVAQVWSALRGRVLRLLVVQAVVMAVLALPGVVLVVLLVVASFGPVVLVLLTGALGGLAAAMATLWLVSRLALAGPVVVLERRGIGAALKRSWSLAGGRSWPLLGVCALAAVLALVVFSVLELLLLLVGSLLATLVETTPSQGVFLAGMVTNLATLLSATVVAPFVAGVLDLLYVDTRMRKEGLDVELLRAAARARTS